MQFSVDNPCVIRCDCDLFMRCLQTPCVGKLEPNGTQHSRTSAKHSHLEILQTSSIYTPGSS